MTFAFFSLLLNKLLFFSLRPRPIYRVGGAVAYWLQRHTSNRGAWVRALAEVMSACVRDVIFKVPPSREG